VLSAFVLSLVGVSHSLTWLWGLACSVLRSELHGFVQGTGGRMKVATSLDNGVTVICVVDEEMIRTLRLCKLWLRM